MSEYEKRARSSAVQDAIVNELLDMVIDGGLQPGDRLPTRNEIIEQFGASRETVQSAFERLQEDGFVIPRGRAGTFIAKKLPHLTRYALVFPFTAPDKGSDIFTTKIMTGARMLSQRFGVEFPMYVMESVTSCDAYRRLLRDVRTRRLAGIIFVRELLIESDDPVLKLSSIPMVVLVPRTMPPLSCISVELGGANSFFERALEYLAAQQRRHIALLAVSGIEQERMDYYHHRVKEYGMYAPLHWMQAADPYVCPSWANNLTQLLFHANERERPDGFIITDDNLVNHACAGLVSAGVRTPDDVTVVAHENFPAVSPPVLNIARLGYDVHAALETCVDMINKKNKKEAVPASMCIPARFEWELRETASP